MKIIILSTLLSLFAFLNIAQAAEKIVYKYKKYEQFDLGNLQIKGIILAPGDISVKEHKRKKFKIKLFERENFNDFVREDIDDLR